MCVFHKWGKWTTSHQTNVTNTRTGGVCAYVFIQERTCERCGLTKYTETRIDASD